MTTKILLSSQTLFKLEQGRCVNVDDEQAMACGGVHEPRECWFFDGETEIWTKTHDTVDNHHQGAMARYNNSVIFFGGVENEQGSTEFFNKGSKNQILRRLVF